MQKKKKKRKEMPAAAGAPFCEDEIPCSVSLPEF
jgi:hypothetical protein